MVRWAPDARGRLGSAAMELFGERGFERTTVAEIAERAGLTERTFFRYFSDKREVLFGGAGALRELLAAEVDSAPDSLPPLETIAAALCAADAQIFAGRREFSTERQAIIGSNSELQERELIKLASLAGALADALRRRGVPDPAASLAAEAGIAVFKIAFEVWLRSSDGRTLSDCIRTSVVELRSATEASEPVAHHPRRTRER